MLRWPWKECGVMKLWKKERTDESLHKLLFSLRIDHLIDVMLQQKYIIFNCLSYLHFVWIVSAVSFFSHILSISPISPAIYIVLSVSPISPVAGSLLFTLSLFLFCLIFRY